MFDNNGSDAWGKLYLFKDYIQKQNDKNLQLKKQQS